MINAVSDTNPAIADVVSVIHIDVESESLHFRPYDEVLGISNFLNSVLDKLPNNGETTRTVISCFSAADVERVKATIGLRNVVIYRQNRLGELNALAEVGRSFRAKTLVLFPLGSIFAPTELAEEMLKHHLRSRNDATTEHNLPVGVAPVILELSIVKRMLSIPGAGLARVLDLIDRLNELARSASLDLPFAFKSLSYAFDRSSEQGLFPRRILFRGSEDIEVANVALGHVSATGSTLAGLCAWREEKIKRSHRRRDFAREVGLPLRCGFGISGERARILFVSDPSAFSGAEQSLCQLVANIDSTRYEKIALIGQAGVYTDTLASAGARVEVRCGGFGHPSLDNVLFALATLRRLQPNLVHLNGHDGASIPIAASLLGIPIVQHVRNVLAEDSFEEALQIAQAIICVSDFARDFVTRYDVDTSKIDVIYDEVDTTWFRPNIMSRSAARLSLGVHPDAVVVSMIARMIPLKRHSLLLEAAASITKDVPRLHLLLTGETHRVGNSVAYAEDVRRKAAELKIADRITWNTFSSDIRMVHCAADLLVLCSRHEALGRCVVESMAMAVPVVVTDSGGMHEVVKHGVTGLVVHEDSHALADALRLLLTDERKLKSMGEAARFHAENNLSATVTAKQTQMIYERLLSRPQNEVRVGLCR